ncbi:hypothetical protein [Nocardia arthritidis]|uniref:Lipoprotein n=1 Tax=Nocardia arthritidis TaxID=228602 RepID=A0A6G9YCT5_9NOCA|nr:hypothetical protein [Nocardia arthritidis]QIS10823.1 hypothetical protein F5544_14695 [Nocardia arthritidis]
MPQRRWMPRSLLLFAGGLVAVAVTACGNSANPAQTGSSGSTTSSASPSKPAGPEISDQAAAQLCDMIRPELSNWRVQGPTLGKIGLNAAVHEWALRNGAINGAVLADKPIIDRVTTKSCSDVRAQAIDALQIPDLASGLAF